MLICSCRHTDPPAGGAIPASAQLHAEGDRDSHSCMSDAEPAARDRLREMAVEYHAFHVEFGAVLDEQWDAVLREVMFGTRLDHCSRTITLLDQLDAEMKRARAKK